MRQDEFGDIFGPFYPKQMILHDWNVINKCYLISSSYGYIYKSGFHIFTSLPNEYDLSYIKDKECLLLYKVEYTDIIAMGINTGLWFPSKTIPYLPNCAVVKKYRILEEVNKKCI